MRRRLGLDSAGYLQIVDLCFFQRSRQRSLRPGLFALVAALAAVLIFRQGHDCSGRLAYLAVMLGLDHRLRLLPRGHQI